MRRRNQHRHEYPSEERLRRVVAASGLAPGQEEAGLAFARELVASMHRAPDPGNPGDRFNVKPCVS
jgi:hypothetical protein